MTKAEMIAAMAEAADIPQRAATQALDRLAEEITKALARDGECTLQGIGALVVRESAARKGRNVRTGEEIDIPAKRRVAFRPSSALKLAVNQPRRKAAGGARRTPARGSHAPAPAE